jgi:hypothetical protein
LTKVETDFGKFEAKAAEAADLATVGKTAIAVKGQQKGLKLYISCWKNVGTKYLLGRLSCGSRDPGGL